MIHNFSFSCLPEDILSLAQFFSPYEGTALFFSGSHLNSAKQSLLFLFPFKRITIDHTILPHTHPWDSLREQINDFDSTTMDYPTWSGFLTYEMGAFSEEDITLDYHPGSLPFCFFQKCACTIVYDHAKKEGELYSNLAKISVLSNEEQNWLKKLSKKAFLLNFLYEIKHSQPIYDSVDLSLKEQEEGLESYTKKINRIKDQISNGTFYQINLSREFVISGKCDPFSLFLTINNLNPAPFSAFIKLKDSVIISSSPERLLSHKQGLLETRPIKGTMPRGANPEEDLKNKQLLINSEKEKSELLMICDLMRNDLGKISKTGTVKVKELYRLEDYTNVFHLLAIIQSHVKEHIHPIDMIRNCFPGGSVTGCPKLKAIEAIFQLENRSRGIYTGSIGYFTKNGNFDFNIAIRTFLISMQTILFRLGGAIIYDSDAKKEFMETFYKGLSIFKTLNIQTSTLQQVSV